MELNCNICARSISVGRRKALCASCAQATLYDSRIRHVTALLDRENSHICAEAVVRPGNDGVLAALPQDADLDTITSSINNFRQEKSRVQQQASEVRVAAIMEKADELRRQLQDQRDFIEARKRELHNKRLYLATKRDEFEMSQAKSIETVRAISKRTAHRLSRTREKLVDARLVLCQEAALATNFTKRKREDGKSEYILEGIVIPDLRELNAKTQALPKQTSSGERTIAEPHELVSEAFDNVARLLSICAHYLQVRLPAEIILPHEDFPRAVIMPEKSSYKMRDLAFPRTARSQSSSPAASRVIDRENQPRPRPLYLGQPLAQLIKEDPKAYGLFIEGVALLAWDVAWLCKTQGLESVNSFEDFCSVGKNLWHLLMTAHRKQHKPGLNRKASLASGKDETIAEDVAPRLGLFSHASTEHNLASVEGTAILKDWRLANAARLMDKLKSLLLAEISGAEWDLLEEAEWTERPAESPILLGGLKISEPNQAGAPNTTDTDSAAETRRKTSSGWMKVRGRNNDS